MIKNKQNLVKQKFPVYVYTYICVFFWLLYEIFKNDQASLMQSIPLTTALNENLGDIGAIPPHW